MIVLTKFLFKIALPSLLVLSGCSLYKSDGRKFLESQAFEYAGVSAAQNLQQCHRNWSPSGDWRLDQDTGTTFTFIKGSGLRVFAQTPPANFGCEFHFESAEELESKRQSAIEVTLLHLRLGETFSQFAF